MEALQTLKFSLKKEWFNFTGGWQMVPGKMKRGNTGTTKDLLAHLLTGDCQATTDTLLHALSDSNDEDDNDNDTGDNGELKDRLHNDDVEDDDTDKE